LDLAEASILALRLALALGLYAFLFALIRAANGWLAAAPDPALEEAPSARLLRLVVLDGGDGVPLEIRPGDTIGRAASATHRLSDATVSSTHARVEVDQQGWRIADLESTNGTRVNEVPVRGSAPVSAGDVVSLGEVRLRVL